MITIHKISHHDKKRLAIAGVGIGEEEMKHAKHERAFIVD